MATSIQNEKEHVQALSLLALAPDRAAGAVRYVESLTPESREQMIELADSHHVVVRSLLPVMLAFRCR